MYRRIRATRKLISRSRWYENSLGSERGSLVYALRIEEDWREVKSKKYPDSYWGIYPKTDWNYALSKDLPKNSDMEVEVAEPIAENHGILPMHPSR